MASNLTIEAKPNYGESNTWTITVDGLSKDEMFRLMAYFAELGGDSATVTADGEPAEFVFKKG